MAGSADTMSPAGVRMGRSERLRLPEVRALFHLVGECRELGDDAEAWRQHMVAGLGRLTGAQVVMGGEARLVGPEGLLAPAHFADHGDGPNAASRAYYLAWLDDPHVLDNPADRVFNRLPGR